ncbi:hypothetical protein FBEOM_14552, partial [Fusarium beomiforme]
MINQVAPPDPRCPRSQPAFLRDSLPKPRLNGRLREEPVARPSLTLLPSTVYQPPARPLTPRSMSPPIPDDPGQCSCHR